MILARLENLLTVAVINLKKLLTRNELKLIIIMDSHPTYEELKLYKYFHVCNKRWNSHPTYEELKLGRKQWEALKKNKFTSYL